MWLNIIMHDQKDHSQYDEHNLSKKLKFKMIKDKFCEGMGLKSLTSKDFLKIYSCKRKKSWELFGICMIDIAQPI